MSYHFNGGVTDDYVEFANPPLLGTLDAVTVAVFFKRTTVGTADAAFSVNNSALTSNKDLRVAADNKPYWFDGTNFPNGTQVMSSSSTWYLLAFTKAAGTATPRFHVHDGTSWSHVNGSSVAASFTVGATDRVRVGIARTTQNPFTGDIVCVGVKKADSADLTVETLSRTAFSAWRAFGFDWLIGFDASLEAAGILQDQATPGTGDETSISGTTVVADPPGWAWAGAAAATSGFLGFM